MQSSEPYNWNDREKIRTEVETMILKSKDFIKRIKRQYHVNSSGQWLPAPSVTTLLGVIDKSKPLTIWAERMQRQADIAAAFRLYQSGMPEGLQIQEFSDIFTSWAGESKAAQDALRKAGDIGTQVHAMIEHNVKLSLGQKTAEPEIGDDAMYAYTGWEEWAKTVDFLPVAAEFPVGCPKNVYAGTPDCLAWVNGELVLVDWKTSSGLYGEFYIQSTAYRAAMETLGIIRRGIQVPGLLVQLPKDDPNAEIHTAKVDPNGDEERLNVFLSLKPVLAWKTVDDARGLAEWKRKKAAERARNAS